MPKRKTITLTEAMSQRISDLAEHWSVSESEAMRRLFALGAFLAAEMNKGSTILTQDDAEADPVRLVFPTL